ncbi:MAG: autotransporter-associated beta strand repeat-containing protein, partial [Verrucomicrobiia bacterium]
MNGLTRAWARCALVTTLLLASGAQAQTTNVFTNQTTGFWTAAGSWVGGNMPVVGGSNDYIIIFNNTATDWSTNNRASVNTFLLNQLVFNGTAAVNITNAGSTNLVFVNDSLSALPQINQNNNLANTIYSGLTLNNNLTVGGSGGSPGLLALRGAVSGSGSLTMTGAFTLLLTANNTYTGGTIINGGILRLGNTNALGAPSGGTVATVNAGGSLDLNGYAISSAYNTKTLYIAGFGSGGFGSDSGAVYSAGASVVNIGLANVTLTGDAAIGGGAGRMDITGIFNGGGFTLYKVGINDTFFAGSAYLTNTPTVIITNGAFGLQSSAHLAGAGNTTFIVQTNGVLRTYSNLTFTNAIVVNGGRVQQQGGGTPEIGSVWNSPVTLNGVSNRFDVYGGALTIGGPISGAGDLVKIGLYKLSLNGTNTYTGGTLVTTGLLQFASVDSRPATGVITMGSNAAVTIANSATLSNDLLPFIAQYSSGAMAIQAANANENFDFNTLPYTNLSLGAASTLTYTGTYTPYQSSSGANYYRLAAYTNVVFTFTNTIADDFNGGSQPASLFINSIHGSISSSYERGGIVQITNANTYTGPTLISSGAYLRITHSDALGSTNGATTVLVSGQLMVAGNITVNEALTLNGEGIYSGALRNDSGTNVWGGRITVGTLATPRISIGSGSLIITGGVDYVSGTPGLNLQGGGTGLIVTGQPIVLSAASTISVYSGPVLWAVTNNTFGTMAISWGGTLQLLLSDSLPNNVVLQLGSGGSGAEGAVLDLFGNNQTVSRFFGGNTSNFSQRITNSSSVMSTLTTLQTANTYYGGNMGGALSLVKEGTGLLTLG